MLAALESAETLYFSLEYVSLSEEGHMFHQIEDILEKKVKQGVGGTPDLPIDVGLHRHNCPPRYYKQLQKKGHQVRCL